MPALVPFAALALGAGAMYLCDPQQGRTRRARLSDRISSRASDVRDFAAAARRDVVNRARGLRAGASGLRRAGEVPDAVLVSRVRAKMGRYVSSPSAITVDAHDGAVTLSGPVRAAEHRGLVNATHAVRGVRTVSDRLEVHWSGTHVPALQGHRDRVGERFEFAQSRWSPSARVLAGGAATAVLLWSLARRTPTAAIAGFLAGLLLVRATEPGR
jgi:hypothetical protein